MAFLPNIELDSRLHIKVNFDSCSLKKDLNHFKISPAAQRKVFLSILLYTNIYFSGTYLDNFYAVHVVK